MSFRTDRNNNPAAFTTDIAHDAGLVLGMEYEIGDPFQVGNQIFHTARLLIDPIALTTRVIDKLTYYTKSGTPRWTYIAIPQFIWNSLDLKQRNQVIAFHYQHEGGTELRHLFG